MIETRLNLIEVVEVGVCGELLREIIDGGLDPLRKYHHVDTPGEAPRPIFLALRVQLKDLAPQVERRIAVR